jgi:hypothetical protein
MNNDWDNQDWTEWIPLRSSPKNRKIIPTSQGIYRVRAEGYSELVYLGQTNNLKRRTASLARHLDNEAMPYNDPHTAAPNLWSWRQEKEWSYEVSVTETALSRQTREAYECYLLWQYRLESGQSTLCNHGRFHKDYIKSGPRSSNVRGRILREHEDRNPSGGPSSSPLHSHTNPISQSWMGLEWSPINMLSIRDTVPNSSGLYKIIKGKNVVYFGETEFLFIRLGSHNRKFKENYYSYSLLDSTIRAYQRRELENDLIGNYYQIFNKAPDRQFNRKN